MGDDKQRLVGRVAIVSGAGGGIGKGEALLLGQQGASVVVNDVGTDESGNRTADLVVDEIRAAGGKAEANYDDVSDSHGAAAIVQHALDAFGQLDILVNNAGVITGGLVETISDEDWDRLIAVHLRGTFLLTKNAVPGFKRQRSGVIVNTASESGLGHATLPHYSAAKEGIVGLTRSVAREVGGFGVRCNAIRPRGTGSQMGKKYRSQSEKWRPGLDALGQFGLGERGHIKTATGTEVLAPMVVWLCTDAAANVNGCTFAVEGTLFGIWSEPSLVRSIVRPGGWDLDSLDAIAPESLVFDLENRFHVEFEP